MTTAKDSFEVEVVNVNTRPGFDPGWSVWHPRYAGSYELIRPLDLKHTAKFYAPNGILHEVGISSDLCSALNKDNRMRVTFEAVGPELPPVIDTEGLRRLEFKFDIEGVRVKFTETLGTQGQPHSFNLDVYGLDSRGVVGMYVGTTDWNHEWRVVLCGTFDWRRVPAGFKYRLENFLHARLGPDRPETDEELHERVARARKALGWPCDWYGYTSGGLDSLARECGLKRENVPTLKAGPGEVAKEVKRRAGARFSHATTASVHALSLIEDLAGAVHELAQKVDR